jgi:hypothetical protein
MCNISTYLGVTYFPTYLPIHKDLILIEWVIKVKPDINSLEVHPQLSLISHNQHPVDGVLMGDGSIWMKITNHDGYLHCFFYYLPTNKLLAGC